MVNTSLPTNITPGSTGLIEHANTVHEEVNRLSRDTGWRGISHLLINGWKADSMVIRRVDHTVILEFVNLDGTDATSTSMLPVGPTNDGELSRNFTPDRGAWRSAAIESVSSNWRVNIYGNTTGLGASFAEGGAKATGSGYRSQVIWHTFRNFPARLPPAA